MVLVEKRQEEDEYDGCGDDEADDRPLPQLVLLGPGHGPPVDEVEDADVCEEHWNLGMRQSWQIFGELLG